LAKSGMLVIPQASNFISSIIEQAALI